jgi:uncharacterized protein (TIRG00374 family)
MWLAVKDTDIQKIGRALSDSRAIFAVPVLAFLFSCHLAKSYRWKILVQPLRAARLRDVFKIVMLGFASNSVLPAQLGELVRMHLLGRHLKLRNSAVLATIILERMFDFLVVVLLLGAALVTSQDVSAELASVGYFVGGAGLALTLFCFMLTLWTSWFIRAIDRVLFFVPARIRKAVVREATLAAEGLNALRNKRLLSASVLASIVQWFLMGTSIYISLLAVGISAPFAAVFVVVAFNVAGLSLPSTPGFFGTIELCFVLALRQYGVETENAVAAAIFWHLLAFTSTMAVSLVIVLWTGYSVREIDWLSDPNLKLNERELDALRNDR